MGAASLLEENGVGLWMGCWRCGASKRRGVIWDRQSRVPPGLLELHGLGELGWLTLAWSGRFYGFFFKADSQFLEQFSTGDCEPDDIFSVGGDRC